MSRGKTAVGRSPRLVQKVVDVVSIVVVVVATALIAERWLLSGEATLLPDSAVATDLFSDSSTMGRWIGSRGAAVEVVVFSDYQCGFCAQFDQTLQLLERRYPQHLAVLVKHFVAPTASGSKLDVPQGAECAAEQGRFEAYHRAAFALGPRVDYADAWRRLGDEADVPDQAAFEECVLSRRYLPRIAAQYSEGRRLGIASTPSSFVNGTMVVGAVPLSAMDSLIAARLPNRQRTPF